MRAFAFVLLATTVFAGNAPAQSDAPPSLQELAEISARGKALAEYDQAAWHASDAVEATHPATAKIGRYVARKTSAGWAVTWGYFDPAHTSFLITYEAIEGAHPTEYSVTRHDPPQPDKDYPFHAASAVETATKDFLAGPHPGRQYNISVLPATDGNWYVYAMPAQTDLAILPYGGDVRYTISVDGAKILDRRQMHKTVLEETLPKGDDRPGFDFHTHILSDVPEDSDVFYAMTRKAVNGEWITSQKYVYEITPEFSLGYLGKTKEVSDLLSRGDCRGIHAAADMCADGADATRLMALSALWHLTGTLHEAWPLSPSVSFDNPRCKDGNIWLTLTVSLRNEGDKDLIISREVAGNWIQARFANSPADLIAGKYEKLAFFAVDPKSDPSKDESFAPLAPGKEIDTSKDVPLVDLDPKGKNVVEFVVFAGFPEDDKRAKEILDRFANSGTLYTDAVLTDPLPFSLDPKLVESCKK